MTLVEEGSVPPGGGGGGGRHVGDLRLRRFRVGELGGAEREEVERHTAACGSCRTKLAALADEQAVFEHEIPFARFAGGVERARRVPRARPAARAPRALWGVGATLAAAAAAFVLVARTGSFDREPAPAPGGERAERPAAGRNTTKSAVTSATVVVARADGAGQRPAPEGALTALAPGERLRVGYRAEAPRHVVIAALDDAGAVTPLYPESGRALAAPARAETVYLPDSVELTGRGRERLYAIVSTRPLTVEDVKAALAAAFAAAGRDLARTTPALPDADTFTWLFEKP
jgi:hypothetical protein